MIRSTKDGYELIDREGNVLASSTCLETINFARRFFATEEIRPPLSSRPRQGVHPPVSSMPPYGPSKVYKD